jgi:hypothetical protein
MSGGRAGVVLEETLWRYLFADHYPQTDSLQSVLAYPSLGYPPLRRSAIQGFTEDYTGTAATGELLTIISSF